MDQDDKLSAHKDLFGKMVAVQTMTAVPYLVVGPRLDSSGKVVQMAHGGTVRPAPMISQQAENVLLGVLGPSPDGTQLELELHMAAPTMPRDAYVRGRVRFPPGIVTYVTVLEEYVTPSSLIM